jgi:starch-binding outer membrane protein, SusD/RagB family
VLTAFGAITYACKNFLDQPAQGTLDSSTLTNRVGVEGSLVAAYRALDCDASSAGSWGCAASNWVWGSVTSGDAYKGSNLGDQQPINDIETGVWANGEAEGYVNQKWSQVYEGVSRSNAVLRLLKEVVTTKPGEFSTAEADQIRGEATFLRAHYHFEAYRMWGHIPYYFETDTDLRKANDASLDSIAKLIISDLDTAARYLPVTPRNGDKGRVTKWAARAYKGRVQAYAASVNATYWPLAQQTLQAVRDSGPYKLETSFDHVWTAYPAYRNGPETILAFQASVKDGEPSGWNSNWGERLNFPHSGSHFGCCGFHQASFNLVNFYRVDNSGLPVALASSAWNNPPRDTGSAVPITDTGYVWKGLNFTAGHMDPVDPRLDWTLGRDNVPYKDWTVQTRGWIRDASYSGPYSPKKNIHEQNAPNAENNVGWQATQTNDVPIHIFRYADALLLLAEADIETGNLDSARTIVNEIRARAGQTAQWCGNGADTAIVNRFPTCAGDNVMAKALSHGLTVDSLQTPWAFYRVGRYTTPFVSAAVARNAVHIERRLELAMEGQHFFDLRRWGGADTVIKNYRTVEETRIPYLGLATDLTLPKYQFYPIPSIQIELSMVGGQQRLVQNTGW